MRPSIAAFLAGTFHNGRVVFVDDHFLGAAQIFDLHVLEFDTEIFGDGTTAGEGRNIFHDRLATITKCRRLHGGDLDRSADLVHDKRRQGFAFDCLQQ